jgi:hypothetical protein
MGFCVLEQKLKKRNLLDQFPLQRRLLSVSRTRMHSPNTFPFTPFHVPSSRRASLFTMSSDRLIPPNHGMVLTRTITTGVVARTRFGSSSDGSEPRGSKFDSSSSSDKGGEFPSAHSLPTPRGTCTCGWFSPRGPRVCRWPQCISCALFGQAWQLDSIYTHAHALTHHHCRVLTTTDMSSPLHNKAPTRTGQARGSP